MTEKKKSNIWLYISIISTIIVIVLLGIILLSKGNDNSDNFEKKTYCHSLYDKVHDDYSEKFFIRNNDIRQYLSDFDLFYNKEFDSCIIAYRISETYYDDIVKKSVNKDTYIIKDYLSENNSIFYCVKSDENLYNSLNSTCFLDYENKLNELRK